MTYLSPNQIAAMIYFMGGWGANTGVAVDASQAVKRPDKNDPVRIKCEQWLDTALAVCLAESGGNTDAKNPSSPASGLWQILATLHAKKIAEVSDFVNTKFDGGGSPKPTIFDPRVNTLVAARIYKEAGNQWTPWEVYNNGSYKSKRGYGKDAYLHITNKDNLEKQREYFIAMQNQGNASGGGVDWSNGASNLGGQVKDILATQWLAPIREMLSGIGAAIGVFLLGAILLILGAWALFGKGAAGSIAKKNPAIKVAKKVVS